MPVLSYVAPRVGLEKLPEGRPSPGSRFFATPAEEKQNSPP